MKKIKWYNIAEYVDIETGEIITKKNYEQSYYKTNSIKKYEINENYGIIRYIIECKHRGQTRLFN